jgi:disulfide bond formation protein DsbB
MEGCVTSFLIVWFYFDFLNAMRILGVNLIYNTIAFNLYIYIYIFHFLECLLGINHWKVVIVATRK